MKRLLGGLQGITLRELLPPRHGSAFSVRDKSMSSEVEIIITGRLKELLGINLFRGKNHSWFVLEHCT